MQLRIILVLLACFVSPCFSQTPALKLPLLKVGTDYFTNVTVTKVTATDVYFMHVRGFGNAKLKNLDGATQKRFNFDAEKATEAEKNRRLPTPLIAGRWRKPRPLLRSPR